MMTRKCVVLLVLSLLVVEIAAQAAAPASSKIDVSQDACMMCQYVVERLDRAVKESGLLPNVARPNRPTRAEVAQGAPGASFVEVSSKQVEPDMTTPFRVPSTVPQYPVLGASSQMLHGLTAPGTTVPPIMPADVTDPGYHQFYDRLEWQLFNELNNVVDITMDVVCETRMPNNFYDTCGTVAKRQDAVVNMLGRSFLPRDVCVNIEMCSSTSYLFRLKHNPPPHPQQTPWSKGMNTYQDQYNEAIPDLPSVWHVDG